MGVKLVQLAKGKIIGTNDIHLEELVPVDTNVPSSYIEAWDVSKGENDKVTAYLTGSGNDLSLHIYGSGEMKNFAQLPLSQYPYYTAYWAEYSNRIKHICIHNGVTSIGQFTFFGYHGSWSDFYELSTLSISDTVRTIQRYAINYAKLSQVTIPHGTRHICEHAFGCYNSLYSDTQVSIPATVRIIDYSAFRNTKWFCDLPGGFTTVGDGCVIQYVGNATSLTIPAGTKCISLLNWDNRSLCTGITLPDSLKYVAANAFGGFTSLQSIIIPENCRLISHQAFSGCTSLASVFIPASVRRIESEMVVTSTGLQASTATFSPFNGCTNNLKIYCEASSKPDGFGEYWDYTGDNTRATVYWGVSKQEFIEAVMN